MQQHTVPSRSQPDRAGMLAMRRAEQRARTPGFVVVPNRRFDDSVGAFATIIALEQIALPAGVARLSAPDIQKQAFKRAAGRLPQDSMVKRLRRVSSSKSDQPGYRKLTAVGRTASLRAHVPPVTAEIVELAPKPKRVRAPRAKKAA